MVPGRISPSSTALFPQWEGGQNTMKRTHRNRQDRGRDPVALKCEHCYLRPPERAYHPQCHCSLFLASSASHLLAPHLDSEKPFSDSRIYSKTKHFSPNISTQVPHTVRQLTEARGSTSQEAMLWPLTRGPMPRASLPSEACPLHERGTRCLLPPLLLSSSHSNILLSTTMAAPWNWRIISLVKSWAWHWNHHTQGSHLGFYWRPRDLPSLRRKTYYGLLLGLGVEREFKCFHY